MDAKEILKTKKTYAIIGVSQDETKYSYEVFHIMQQHHYNVYPVNPRYEKINTIKCFSSLSDLPQKPEVIIPIMAPHNIEKILDSILAFNDSIIWFPPECFSDEIIEKVKQAGISYVFDDCPIGKLKGL